MRLQAALLPPPDVQAELAGVVASVPGSGDQLAAVPAALLHLRLANFGKVSLRDLELLVDVLQRELGRQPRMRLRFCGGTVLEPVGDDSAWARLAGDVAQVNELANLLLTGVRRIGFLVDRRMSRTLVRVGRITPETTVEYLQRLLDRLEGYTSQEWACRELALLRVADSFSGPVRSFEVLRRLCVGDAVSTPTRL